MKNRPIYFIHECKVTSPEYTYRYLVYAFDPSDGCGFTPQDHNWAWTPDERYKKISKREFKRIVTEQLKSYTTHFPIYKYYNKMGSPYYSVNRYSENMGIVWNI